MADTFVLLQLAHRTLERLFLLIDAQCSRLDSGHPADFELLTMIFAYLREFPRTSHHPKADIAIRRLQLRDPGAAVRMRPILAQRGAVDELTLRVLKLVEEAKTERTARALALRQPLRSYVQAYREYLDAEANELLPELRTRLSRADWDLIDYQIFDQDEPLYDADAENQLLVLRHQIFQAQSGEDFPGATA